MSTDPTIRRRLDRLGQQSVSTGLISVADETALASVGFRPVSEVIGAVANSLRPQGFYGSVPSPLYGSNYAGTWRGSGGRAYLVTPTYTSSTAPTSVGIPPSITALKAGYRTALSRLVAETRAVGADGVVGVRITRTVSHYNGNQLWRFLAVGTAVRSSGRTHTDVPFTTDLSGAQMAGALRGGWQPVSLLIVPCLAIKWIDVRSRGQQRRRAGNGEVEALTDLINVCRHQARQDFAATARNSHADAATMSSMTLDVEIGKPEPVATASVTITGNALVRLGRPVIGPRTLTVMPLRRAEERNR